MMAKFLKYLLCLSVFVCVLCIPSFAFTDGYVDQPIPYSVTISQSLASTDGYTYYGSQKVISNVPNTFCFVVGSKCWIGYKGEAGGRYATSLAESTGMSDSFQAVPGWYFNSNWFYTTSGYEQYYYMPQFPSIDAAVRAAEAIIESSSQSYSYNIPIGYVAVFDNSSSLSLDTYFPTKSGNLYVPELGYWGYTGQQFGVISGSVPTSYPTNFGSSIIWSKSDPKDIWGHTYHGVSSISGSTGKLYVYNPVYRNVSRLTSDYDPSGINGTITISGSGISNFKLYPVTAGFGLQDNIIGDIDTDDFVAVEIDPDTEQPIYTDPDDNPAPVPTPGGSTSLPDEVTNQNFLEKILQVLRNLLSEIGGLFTFAYDAVASLVSAASAFFSVIGGLFVWLPEEVVTIVISGFVLVVTIGVLKSFL